MDIYDICLSDYPRFPEETDDSPRIIRAIQDCPNGILYIPKGVYEIESPIVIRNFCSLRMHPAAILRAVAEMDFVLTYDGGEQYYNLIVYGQDGAMYDNLNLFIRGGDIDGAGLASCLCIRNYHHYTLSDITVHNGKHYGLYTGGGHGYELIANNVYAKCNISGLSGNVGIFSSLADSHFTDCIVVDYTVGMRIAGGANRLTRCHVWGGIVKPKTGYTQEEWCSQYRKRKYFQEGYNDQSKWPTENLPEMLIDSICFDIQGGGNNLDGCYADSGKIGYRIHNYTFMDGCGTFNNFCFGMDHITAIEHLGGDLCISNGRFSKLEANKAVLYVSQNPSAKVHISNVLFTGYSDEEIGEVFRNQQFTK